MLTTEIPFRPNWKILGEKYEWKIYERRRTIKIRELFVNDTTTRKRL